MVKKLKLKDMKGLTIVGGQITSRIAARDGEKSIGSIKVLIPKAIQNGDVNMEDLGTLELKTEVDQKKVTKAGDIVIKLSTPYDACIITEAEEGLLVPSFCAIINDLPDYLNKEYLVIYLNSKSCQTQLRSLLMGTVFAILTGKVILNLEIPVPSMEEQQEFADNYKNTKEKLRLMKKIIALEAEKLDVKIYEMEGENNG